MMCVVCAGGLGLAVVRWLGGVRRLQLLPQKHNLFEHTDKSNENCLRDSGCVEWVGLVGWLSDQSPFCVSNKYIDR